MIGETRLTFVVAVVLVTGLACSDGEPTGLDDNDQDDAGLQDVAPPNSEHNHSQPPEEPECMEEMTSPDACGGHVEGDWADAEVCTEFDLEDEIDDLCAAADVETFDYWVADGSGTVSFDDGSVERDLSVVIDMEMHIPDQCLQWGSQEFDCHTLATTAEEYVGLQPDCQEPAEPDNEAAPGCDCVVDELELDRSVSGDYEANDNLGVLTIGGDDYHYCAEEGVLNMRVAQSEEDEIPMTEAYTFAP